MNRKILFFLIILFMLSLSLRFSLSIISPYKYWDETIYTNLGRNIKLYGEYSFLHGFADFSPNWPLAGFRPPLLPVIIAFVYIFTSSLFMLNLIIPFLSSLGVVGIFFLAGKLFDEKTAVFSSVLFALFSLNIFWSSKILTDSLFLAMLIWACYFFWESFVEKKSIKSSILFGMFAAFAFLSRYSMMWFFPVFFLFLLMEYRSFRFLIEKRFWISAVSFALIVSPWIIFNYFQYGGFLGFLEHASESSLRWGAQPFLSYVRIFLKDFWMFIPFSILGFLRYREKKKEILFLAVWFVVFFISVSLMGHKEARYLLPILPVLCCTSVLGMLKIRKYSRMIFVFMIVILLLGDFHLFTSAFERNNSSEQEYFFNAMNFIKHSGADYVVTEHFSPVYFYTLKPNIRVNNYTETIEMIKSYFQNNTVYYYYSDGDWFNLAGENESLNNFSLYSCGGHRVFILNQGYSGV